MARKHNTPIPNKTAHIGHRKRTSNKPQPKKQTLEELRAVKAVLVCAKIAAWTFGILATIIAIRDLSATMEGLEQTKNSVQEQSITSAWQLLTARSPGNSGKVDALETLDRAGINLVGLDLSCSSQLGLNGNNCRFPVYLEELKLGSYSDLADLREVNFAGANLNYSDMSANLSGADFSNTSLRDASFRFSGGRAVKFSHAFGKVDFSRTFFIGSSFNNASFSDSEFSQSAFINSSFEDTNLLGASFSGSSLELTDFTGANISGVDFTGIAGSPKTTNAVFTRNMPPLVDNGSPLTAHLCPEEIIYTFLDGSMSGILSDFGANDLREAAAVQVAIHSAAKRLAAQSQQTKSLDGPRSNENMNIVGFAWDKDFSFAYGGRLRQEPETDQIPIGLSRLSVVREECELVRISDLSVVNP